MRYSSSISVLAVLLLMFAAVPDSTAGVVAFGVVLTALVITVVAVIDRRDLEAVLFGSLFRSDTAGRRRGAFRRQERPNEAGRPMPRAPGLRAGAL